MISAVILAAGVSKRFGRNKLIEPIGGKPMIRWTVEAAVNSIVDEVIVVLGFEAEIVGKVIKDLPCKIIINENYLGGMSSSVKFGVKHVARNSDAVVIIPGDCPFIGSESINSVVNAFRKTGSPIVIATYKGRRGHPILISRELFHEVLEISEETFGLKQLIKKYEEKIFFVEAPTVGVLIDIDYPEDVDRTVKLLKA
ncbi:MAG: nucleotidyltransferase family protein [archaeon GB-1867-005]|nr:nucleotidyltransferase family protein [Candidatus Culexmicrobium cathedralense]